MTTCVQESENDVTSALMEMMCPGSVGDEEEQVEDQGKAVESEHVLHACRDGVKPEQVNNTAKTSRMNIALCAWCMLAAWARRSGL